LTPIPLSSIMYSICGTNFKTSFDPGTERLSTDTLISVFGNSFSEEDLAGIEKVLQSHLVGVGAKTEEFEKRFKEEIGLEHAVATNSATNAFWLLARALRFASDDEVMLPNIHFHYQLCDVGPSVPNLTLKNLQGCINGRTRAIVFLDYGGFPAPVWEIKRYLIDIGREDIKLILDAANSPFTRVNGEYIGRQYHFVFYSFDMNKILVTGDGGMVLSNDFEVIERIRSLAYHGIKERHKSGFEKARHGESKWWEFTIEEPSLKMVMNNIAASLGLTQLGQMDECLSKRKIIRDLYLNGFGLLAAEGLLSLPLTAGNVENDLFLFWVKTRDEETRNGLARFLLEKGIFTTVRYQPLDPSADTPNAYDFWRRALCLPLHQNIEPDVAEFIVSQVFDYFQISRKTQMLPNKEI
jgi:aminotransferase